jgi:hypothetical protein
VIGCQLVALRRGQLDHGFVVHRFSAVADVHRVVGVERKRRADTLFGGLEAVVEGRRLIGLGQVADLEADLSGPGAAGQSQDGKRGQGQQAQARGAFDQRGHRKDPRDAVRQRRDGHGVLPDLGISELNGRNDEDVSFCTKVNVGVDQSRLLRTTARNAYFFGPGWAQWRDGGDRTEFRAARFTFAS